MKPPMKDRPAGGEIASIGHLIAGAVSGPPCVCATSDHRVRDARRLHRALIKMLAPFFDEIEQRLNRILHLLARGCRSRRSNCRRRSTRRPAQVLAEFELRLAHSVCQFVEAGGPAVFPLRARLRLKQGGAWISPCSRMRFRRRSGRGHLTRVVRTKFRLRGAGRRPDLRSGSWRRSAGGRFSSRL